MIYNILKKYEIKKELKTGNDENVSDDDDVEGGDDCFCAVINNCDDVSTTTIAMVGNDEDDGGEWWRLRLKTLMILKMLHESVLFLWGFYVTFKQEVHATH